MPRRLTLDERREIIALGKASFSQREIAKRVGRPQKTVNRILKAYFRENRVEDARHQRRPRKTTKDEDELILAAAADNPFVTAKAIADELGLNVSLHTVRRRLHDRGLKSFVAARKPLLTTVHRERRLEFADRHINWTSDQWRQVIFSDESTFSTCGNQRLRVWRVNGSR